MPSRSRRRAVLAAVVIAVAAALPGRGSAGEALVAVAANFAVAAERIAAAFAEDTGHGVRLTTGATGKLYAQIREGAPFDALLAADANTPERLEAEGLAVPGTRFTYAIGGLSLWSAESGRLAGGVSAALTDPGTRHIAIANPDLAPYGIAAREAMQSLGVWEAVRSKIVMGQNVGQAFSLVDSGAAELGFVASSALTAPGTSPRGAHIEIPQELFAPIRQDAVLLDAGRDSPAAAAFLDYLRGARAAAIAADFGYGVE